MMSGEALRQHRLLLDERTALVAFRFVIWLLLVFFLLYSDEIERTTRLAPFSLLALYLASNVALLRARTETARRPLLQAAILLFDLGVITATIFLAQGWDTDLYLVYFLVIFMASLDANLARSFLTATVACAVYAALAMRSGADFAREAFLLRIPFFYLVSFFGAFLAAQARQRVTRIEQFYRARLESTEKRAAVGRLAREIAKELGYPIRMILSLSSSLLSTTRPEDAARTSAQSLAFEAQRCDELLRRFLMLSADRAPPFEMVDLNDAAAAAVEEAYAQNRISSRVSVKLDLQPGLPPMRASLKELTLAIVHLIENASEAMSQGGQMTLRTACETPPDGASPRLRLEVIDTGAGIAAFARARLFEPFFTTKRRFSKTGLGLCFVSAIVDRHRGELSIESQPRSGTRVTLAFPKV